MPIAVYVIAGLVSIYLFFTDPRFMVRLGRTVLHDLHS